MNRPFRGFLTDVFQIAWLASLGGAMAAFGSPRMEQRNYRSLIGREQDMPKDKMDAERQGWNSWRLQ